eukprot:712064-Pleurochrysis_carterae.AAC.4
MCLSTASSASSRVASRSQSAGGSSWPRRRSKGEPCTRSALSFANSTSSIAREGHRSSLAG